MSRFTPAARARLRRPQVRVGILMPPPEKEFGQDTGSSPDPAEGYDRFKIRSATGLTRVRPLLTSRRHPPPGANDYTPDQYRVAQKILTYLPYPGRVNFQFP